MSDVQETSVRKSWPDYRAIWRWHFYAGLFTIPFVIVLSISGAIYLFKPQIEAWIDRPYDQLQVSGKPKSAAEQVQAALDHHPGSRFGSYELPRGANTATRVIVNLNGESQRVYVHPESLQVLNSVRDDQRLMRQLFRLHGELWLGDRGSNLVELASSWTIVMILTGLVLWWPASWRGMAGVLYPRLWKGSRILWRDLHSVSGVWISGLVLFLLVTGLPWAKFWGNYFKTMRRMTGTAVAQQDWTTGSERPVRNSNAEGGEHQGHDMGGSQRRRGGRGRWGGGGETPKDLTAIDRIAATVIPMNLPHPVVFTAPSRGSQTWSVKSMTQNRPLRVELELDGATGKLASRQDFKDRHLVDRIVGTCIAAHEGQLFGWPNQLLGLLAAGGLVLISVSGVILWWRRRTPGTLGAPLPLVNPRWSTGLAIAIVLLGVYLPLFGLSFVVVILLEFLILKRIPVVRDWLGLGPVVPAGGA